ncbi:hypothetical protein BLNAU_8927 [Blattamonas nauphoetae]|uniref:Uncharacterized protein n=1 Tax=Blattamonas nauphoetae TaxID=2049346 RepID=A0ABQ9XXC3_9EUKA|nr:hypothetical protein BLNAU_8927 [Blattamonas nauphoetae]
MQKEGRNTDTADTPAYHVVTLAHSMRRCWLATAVTAGDTGIPVESTAPGDVSAGESEGDTHWRCGPSEQHESGASDEHRQ